MSDLKTTICPFLVYPNRLQLKNRVDEYFLTMLWTSVTFLFCCFQVGRNLFFFPTVFRWLFMVFMNKTWFWYYIMPVLIAVLISIAALVPRSSFKNSQVMLCSFVFRFHVWQMVKKLTHIFPCKDSPKQLSPHD